MIAAVQADASSVMRNSQEPVRRRHRRDDKPIIVTDDWEGMPPITDQEVRIIEAFFGELLDELFGPLPTIGGETPRSKPVE